MRVLFPLLLASTQAWTPANKLGNGLQTFAFRRRRGRRFGAPEGEPFARVGGVFVIAVLRAGFRGSGARR